MSADNILETILCVDKLLATIPNVRWAEIVHELVASLADSCQLYMTQHFASILSNPRLVNLLFKISHKIIEYKIPYKGMTYLEYATFICFIFPKQNTNN